MRGWDPGEYTERTVGSLLAELVSAGRRFEGGPAVRTTR
jgi:hypothetical protein